jgi:hypothetical protein
MTTNQYLKRQKSLFRYVHTILLDAYFWYLKYLHWFITYIQEVGHILILVQRFSLRSLGVGLQDLLYLYEITSLFQCYLLE